MIDFSENQPLSLDQLLAGDSDETRKTVDISRVSQELVRPVRDRIISEKRKKLLEKLTNDGLFDYLQKRRIQSDGYLNPESTSLEQVSARLRVLLERESKYIPTAVENIDQKDEIMSIVRDDFVEHMAQRLGRKLNKSERSALQSVAKLWMENITKTTVQEKIGLALVSKDNKTLLFDFFTDEQIESFWTYLQELSSRVFVASSAEELVLKKLAHLVGMPNRKTGLESLQKNLSHPESKHKNDFAKPKNDFIPDSDSGRGRNSASLSRFSAFKQSPDSFKFYSLDQEKIGDITASARNSVGHMKEIRAYLQQIESINPDDVWQEALKKRNVRVELMLRDILKTLQLPQADFAQPSKFETFIQVMMNESIDTFAIKTYLESVRIFLRKILSDHEATSLGDSKDEQFLDSLRAAITRVDEEISEIDDVIAQARSMVVSTSRASSGDLSEEIARLVADPGFSQDGELPADASSKLMSSSQ